MPEPAQVHEPLSEILRDVADSRQERISVSELTDRFGGRALGALLLIFALVCMLPLPPGGTTIFGLPLVLLGPQLVIGKRAPWLPGALRRRTVATADLRTGLPRVMPWLQRVEAVSRPRLAFLFGPIGERLIGVVCTLLAVVLILPIPLGNILPAAAVTVLSLSLVQRDGALALAGHALAVASVGVLVLAFHLMVRAAQQAVSIVTGA